MAEYQIHSHAKVNLYLQVLQQRDDGYHNINTLFSELEFGDNLFFTQSEKFSLTVEGIPVPTDESNLITKAYQLIRKKFGTQTSEFKVTLKKKIPISAGLGGGSSNAAATLTALNHLWNINLSTEEMEKMGSILGADVPFFIQGGLQSAEGIGDNLTLQSVSLPEGMVFLLVIPPIHITTRWAYEGINNYLQQDRNCSKFAPPSMTFNWQLFENDFEGLIISTYPEIGKIKTELKNSGADFASLSGSGSTVFGIYNNLQMAEKARSLFTSYQTIVTFPNRR